MKKLTVITVLITGWLNCYSQKDSLVLTQYKNFEPYKSSFQFTLGRSVPVGKYAGKEEPFDDGFATFGYKNLSLSIQYHQEIKGPFGWMLGTLFFRNMVDN